MQKIWTDGLKKACSATKRIEGRQDRVVQIIYLTGPGEFRAHVFEADDMGRRFLVPSYQDHVEFFAHRAMSMREIMDVTRELLDAGQTEADHEIF